MQPHRDWSELALANGVDVYRYQFTKENGYYGTNHSGEMIYCYGNLEKSSKQFAYDESDYSLSKTMVSYWANFVKTGDPNGEGIANWPKWENPSDGLMELGAHLGVIEEKAKKAYVILDAWKLREQARSQEA
ncbi:MAG: carboxylesterase family protein [Bacilli bacterium]|nr:carboxylesterase family protein [Bacilli bacterium]